MNKVVAVSKYLSYLLRHHPKDLEMSKDGFAPLQQVVSKIQKTFPYVDREFIERLVEQDNNRFQIKKNHIRALYGHSIPVAIQLNYDHKQDILYHGTSEKAAEKILKEGLKPQTRNKVHLSTSKQEAIRVGKRHSAQPVILHINANKARQNGIDFEKATDNVYLCDYIPPDYIFIKE